MEFAGRADLWKRVEHLLPGQLHPWSPPLLSTYTHVSAICSPQLVFAWNNCRPVLFRFLKNSPLLMNRALSWRNVTPLKGLNIFHIWLFLLYFLLLLLSVYLSLHQLLLVCPLLCFLPLFLYLLAPEEDNFCRKRSCIIVSLRFVALVSPFP